MILFCSFRFGHVAWIVSKSSSRRKGSRALNCSTLMFPSTLLRHDERALLRITRFGFKTMKDYFDGRGEKERMVDYFRVSLDNS